MKRPPLISELPPPPPGRSGWPWTEAPAPVDLPPEAPDITIVTPSYNQAAYLEETLRSVLLQGYGRLQYLVIDGGSTDDSVDLLRRYAPWLDYWVSEKDSGQSEAINKGLSRATGRWRNWINSDDTLQPGALAAVAKAVLANRDCVAVCGLMDTVDSTGRLERRPPVRLEDPLEEAIVEHRTCQPSMFYEQDWLKRLDPVLHYAMDYDLWVRALALRGSAAVVRIDTPLSVFRLHPQSKTCSQEERFEGDERVVLRRLCEVLGSSPSFLNLLAPSAKGGSFGDGTPRLNRSRLERVLVQRFLLGELRSAVRAKGLAGLAGIFPTCFVRKPKDSLEAAAKYWVKGFLDRRRRA